jgi:hypothetical protein
MRSVAQALPCLQHLQLGDYKDTNIPSTDVKWGKSGRWMEYVMQRSESNQDLGGGESTGAVENEGQSRNRGGNRRGGQCGAVGLTGDDEVMLVEAIDKLWHTEARK